MKKMKKKTVLIIGGILVLGLLSNLIPLNKAVEPEKVKAKEVTKVEEVAPTGINQDLFITNLNQAIATFNEADNGFTFTYTADVVGASADVDLTFSDMAAWSSTNEIDRKEFVNIMGKLMDKIATNSAYNNTDTVGAHTSLYSPSGMLLAERTLFGNIKLY